jgi:spectinomycin phosphotransferase
MYEPPVGLSDVLLLEALRDEYARAVTALTFLPLGHDSSAWVYRVEAADGPPLFLKVRAGITNPASLIVPRFLRDCGVARVVAPIPTRAGAVWAEAAGYALILYPFIAGATGMQQGLTPQQWREYGAALRDIHATPIPPELAGQLHRETFRPAGADTIRRLDAMLDDWPLAEPSAQALAAFWRERRSEIHALFEQGVALGQRLEQAPPPSLLCHADIHTNNVLVDPAGQIWIVDWDETMLAPRERDLMFVIGGISAKFVGPQEEAWFAEGYGPIAVDPVALAYYRYAWALGDIGAFAAEVVLRPDLGTVTKQAAVRSFVGLFAPGEIVAIARGLTG